MNNWRAMCISRRLTVRNGNRSGEAFLLWSSTSFFIINLPRTCGHPQRKGETETEREDSQRPRLYREQRPPGIILLSTVQALFTRCKRKVYMCRKLIQGSLLNLFSSQKNFYSTYHIESSNTYMEY